jgi:hypothetical protein
MPSLNVSELNVVLSVLGTPRHHNLDHDKWDS